MRVTFARKTMSLAVALALALIFGMAQAIASKPMQVSPEQARSIKAITDYINSFKTMEGEFTQISPKGNMSRGVFVIAKPGKMRFEYAPPNPFLIVSDGKWLTIKNRTKEKGDQFPLSQTPLNLVLSNQVDLIRDTNILDFQEQDGITTVTLEDKDAAMGGKLTLVFDQAKGILQQWIVTDSKGRQTTVSLENMVAGGDPDPQLFVVKFDRKEKGKQ